MSRRPENVVLTLVIAAWAWIVVHAATSPTLSCCTPTPTWVEDFVAWTAMIVAMMVPTTIPQMRDVAVRSYRARRMRSVASYAVGYCGLWLALGGVLCLLRDRLPSATAFALLGAAWMLVPYRLQWHRRCHRRLPLHPVTWRATISAFRQGAAHGVPCLALCWPLMIACMLTDHSLFMMLACAALVVFEKRMRRLHHVQLVIAALALAGLTVIL